MWRRVTWFTSPQGGAELVANFGDFLDVDAGSRQGAANLADNSRAILADQLKNIGPPPSRRWRRLIGVRFVIS